MAVVRDPFDYGSKIYFADQNPKEVFLQIVHTLLYYVHYITLHF